MPYWQLSFASGKNQEPMSYHSLFHRFGPSNAPNASTFSLWVDADSDPDPACHFDADPAAAFHIYADPDTDPASQNDADPDPQLWYVRIQICNTVFFPL